MHPMLISSLADEIVRERSQSCETGLSRSLTSKVTGLGPHPARRGGIWLVLRPLVPRRAS
jgi:hypothetical protein